MSRRQLAMGGSQWPLVGLHTSGSAHSPPVVQPGTQVPPEQICAGASGHSASLLHVIIGGVTIGQSPTPGVQQWPVVGLQVSPLTQTLGLTVQPASQVCVATRQMTSGGSQSSSPSHWAPMPPPSHSPVAALHCEPATHELGSETQPGTQRPSAEQMVSGGEQSREVAQPSVPTMSVRLQ